MFRTLRISPIGGLGTSQRTGWGLYFKNTNDYRNKIFNKVVCIINAKSWGLQDRYGIGMKWSDRVRNLWGWGLKSHRQNSPPKIDNIHTMIYLWSWIWIEGKNRYSIFSIPYILRWFKYKSFLTHLKKMRGIKKWIIQTSCTHYETV